MKFVATKKGMTTNFFFIPLVLDPRSVRIYRHSFREHKLKTLVFHDCKRSVWACFRENRVFEFGHRDLGWVKIRIRDKHPGSATLLLGLIS